MPVRLYGVLAEEQNRSMDIYRLNLEAALNQVFGPATACSHVPAFRPYLGWLGKGRAARLDFWLNCYLTYGLPEDQVGLIHHLVDHSYAHLLFRLPVERTVITCHDINIYFCREASRSAFYRARCGFSLAGLRRARWVACVSEFTRRQLLEYELAPVAQTAVIPNGLNPAFVELPAAQVAQLTARYRLPEVLTVLHVGTCFERKNIPTLLRAVARVQELMPVHLLKVGGRFTSEQQQQIAALGLTDHLTHIPNASLAELVALYNRADVLVFPSRLEGFGFPVLEAMACGVPVVAADATALPEVVGEAGLLAHPDDPEGFASQILAIATRPELRATLVARGRERARQFRWTDCARQLGALYRQVVA